MNSPHRYNINQQIGQTHSDLDVLKTALSASLDYPKYASIKKTHLYCSLLSKSYNNQPNNN